MRIATWNIERLKHKDKLEQIKRNCLDMKADILVLTEADSRLDLGYSGFYSTPPAKDVLPRLYGDTENRVTICANYPIQRTYETYDKYTAACMEVETELGNLIVYGTIMGIFGNREKSYEEDLKKQIEDIKRLSSIGNLCVIGDYNCSFSDNYYFTKNGRQSVIDVFDECRITMLTASRKECIDHISISDSFVGQAEIAVDEWNYDKSLSDHKGIVVDIKPFPSTG